MRRPAGPAHTEGGGRDRGPRWRWARPLAGAASSSSSSGSAGHGARRPRGLDARALALGCGARGGHDGLCRLALAARRRAAWASSSRCRRRWPPATAPSSSTSPCPAGSSATSPAACSHGRGGRPTSARPAGGGLGADRRPGRPCRATRRGRARRWRARSRRPCSPFPDRVAAAALLILVGAGCGGAAAAAGSSGRRVARASVGGDGARAAEPRRHPSGSSSRRSLVLAGHVATFVVAARAVGVPASRSVELVPLGAASSSSWRRCRSTSRAGVRARARPPGRSPPRGSARREGLAVAVAYGAIVLVATLPGAVLLLAGRSPWSRVADAVGARRPAATPAPRSAPASRGEVAWLSARTPC